MEYFRKIFSLLLFLSLMLNTAAAGDKVSEEVKSRMQKGEKVPVIILLKDQPSLKALSKENAIALLNSHASNSQKNIAALLNEEKGKGKADKIRGFWIVNAIAADASPDLIEKLAISDDVERIEFDSELIIVEDFSAYVSQGQIANATSEIKRINATKVWELGIDGTGINVSVIDTGINASHPDIAGRVIKWVDFVNGNNIPYDDNGHGTHVAGTVGGNGSKGITTGVAPNVSLFGVKVIPSTGSISNFSNLISGIQWSVENKADVISISLGIYPPYPTSNCDSAYQSLANAINNSVALDVTVIAAAGKRGDLGVSSPGCISSTIAVGAVDSNDVIFYQSGFGYSMSYHGVVAPGDSILSLRIIPDNLSKEPTYSIYNNDYAYLSGTSQATPHVSGTVALILQAARKNGITLTPLQIKYILQNTSIDLGAAGKDNTYGAGRINVSNATAAVASYDASIGQNTYIQSSNGSFGALITGQTKPLNDSVILNNTGDIIAAKVEARFNNSINGVYGITSGINVLNASNFAFGIPGAPPVPLNNSGANIQVAVAAPGVTALAARLSVPAGQAAGEYSGTVILTFSNI